ncbi:unnamed protein product [Cuscuta epithymum]|uniref:AT5G11810-like protein n=1 Tax=Cuscuta epithymum TaxID=186058 RepID=A0AAV0ELV8_9ASTE|nr:unnamed protein product [Cuscuta epithymum]
MADKPSRGLVLYGDGLARSVLPSHTHLHSLASRACSGFLSLPDSPPSENEDARIVREFAELLDSREAYNKMNEEDISEMRSQNTPLTPTISQRFMGMKAAIVSDNPILKVFCDRLGVTTFGADGLLHCNSLEVGADGLLHCNSLEVKPLVSALELLGLQNGKVSEMNRFDLVILHVESVEDINGLVGELLTRMAQPGTEVGSRLHLSVVLSFGAVSYKEDSKFSFCNNTRNESNSQLHMLFPRQSYTMKGGKTRENVRHHCPMLVAQWQDGVTRKDAVGAFSFEDIKEEGGNLVIPVDRFLHELAFKLWKAPKYGA